MSKFKSQTLKSFFIFSLFVVSLYGAATFAMDCPGGRWVNGGLCRDIGLDTHRGVCSPGAMFETLCDDRRGSNGQAQHITCQGSQRCYNPHNDYDDDYNDYNDHNDYYNDYNDHNNYSCNEWDFNRNRPCQPGYINRDCYGGCERRRY